MGLDVAILHGCYAKRQAGSLIEFETRSERPEKREAEHCVLTPARVAHWIRVM
jgi:hypothetical protein